MKLNDELLAEYVALNEEVKAKTKRLEEIKKACKERGSFTTKNFMCAIDVQNRVGLPGLDEVTKHIAKETLMVLGLLRTTSVVSVRITPKVDKRELSVSQEYKNFPNA
jgi:hypothetical protein